MPCLRPRSAAFMVAACLAVVASPGRAQAPRYDIVITGGTLIDGSGAPGRRADVGIKGGQIVAMGAVPNPAGSQTIDATDLVVAPGFIDVHTHADDIAETPRAENFVRMGVTSVVAGNCGGSALDVGEALTTIRRAGVAVNFATLIGHNTVRRAAMGTANRDATVSELAKMKSLVWRAIADGAVGFSTGLQYVPGTYANNARDPRAGADHRQRGRPVRLAHAKRRHRAGRGGRGDHSHRRAGQVPRADFASEGGQPEPVGRQRPGARAHRRGARARHRRRGGPVCLHGRELDARHPLSRLDARGGADAISGRLGDAATWAKIKTEMRAMLAERGLADLSFAVVASYEPDPWLNGLSMKQVALKLKGSDSLDAQLETAREMMIAGGASMVYHFMSDEDVDRIMRHPHVAIASDSSVLTVGDGIPHPRGYGNNVRVLGEYVRRRHVIWLEEAMRKMTSLPAPSTSSSSDGDCSSRGTPPTSPCSTRGAARDARHSRSRTRCGGRPLRPGERGGRRPQRAAHQRVPRAGPDAQAPK